VHFPLHPETPVQGITLEQLFPGRDLAPVKQKMKGLMEDAGLPYGDRTMTYNSRLAQELGKWADSQQAGDAIHDQLYRAYFVKNINIGDIDQLVKIADSAGLDATRARQVLENREYKEQVDEDWERSRRYGITGVPTFYSSGLMVVGCQPYENLEKFVKHLMREREQ
jgi:predicted DsbA family dithiol-disulfide isomerase